MYTHIRCYCKRLILRFINPIAFMDALRQIHRSQSAKR